MQDIKITIVQQDIYWEDVKKNLDTLSQKLNSLQENTDLIILPEMFNTVFTMNVNKYYELINGRTIRWMRDIAINKNCAITGSLIIKENDNFYNRLIWINSDGSLQYYDKHHLFRMASENQNFSEGERRIVTNIKGFNFLPLICYDLRFPVWSRNRYNSHHDSFKYDCVIYIANWPEKRSFAWKTLLQARAIENQSYVIGVNRIGTDYSGLEYIGESMVINSKGKCINNPVKNAENIETVTLSYSELDEYRKAFEVAKDWDKYKVFTKADIENYKAKHKEKIKKNKSILVKIKKNKILILILIVLLLIVSAVLLTINERNYQYDWSKYQKGKKIENGRLYDTKDNLQKKQ
jgi:predicted amidohydrolase